MMNLSINIDHIATIRNARGGTEPDPVAAAEICERAGADGIVVHLREDRRHIKDKDVRILRESVKTKLDLEMGANEDIILIALEVVPDLITLVPEKRQELTTEGGLDVVAQKDKLGRVIERFHEKKIPVSLFIHPDRRQIDASKEIGADMIELHTGEYSDAVNETEQMRLFKQIQKSAVYGKSIELGVNAGHGLNYGNVARVAEIGAIDEMSIGHSIISRAAFVGLERAVKEMLALVKK
ncbi:MAG: pyridoxine 5'-phosphate synthase [Ignavibacteriales bacterium]|nr:pyridoxine 5'-phosphate synthase [Ignavibacteriales bacterium]